MTPDDMVLLFHLALLFDMFFCYASLGLCCTLHVMTQHIA